MSKCEPALNSFETKAVGFCKRAADVVVVQSRFIKFFTARGSNDRQTFDWMNSIKFRVSLLAKHWTYQTLNERINAAVVILPIEKNIQRADIVDVEFFVNFFRRKIMEDRQPVDESNSIKFKGTLVGEHTTYLINSNGTSKYLRCDFAE